MALHDIAAAFALAHALHCAAFRWLLHCTLLKVNVGTSNWLVGIIGISIAGAYCACEVCVQGSIVAVVQGRVGGHAQLLQVLAH